MPAAQQSPCLPALPAASRRLEARSLPSLQPQVPPSPPCQCRRCPLPAPRLQKRELPQKSATIPGHLPRPHRQVSHPDWRHVPSQVLPRREESLSSTQQPQFPPQSEAVRSDPVAATILVGQRLRSYGKLGSACHKQPPGKQIPAPPPRKRRLSPKNRLNGKTVRATPKKPAKQSQPATPAAGKTDEYGR